MANRIRSNTYIIDATGNIDWPGESDAAKVSCIAFWRSDTNGLLELAYQSDTADVVIKMQSPINQPNTINMRWSGSHYMPPMRIVTVNNGTGFIYFA